MSNKVAVIQFPGSNCERETILALKRADLEPHEVLWNASADTVCTFDAYVIVGGFSYEDRGRAGMIAALSPIMRAIAQQSTQGKPVIGICNGAQVLVEAGLVPGTINNTLALALTENKRTQNGKIIGTGYYNAWVHIKLCKDYQRNVFTRYLQETTILKVPVAHAQGRFVISPALLQEITMQGLHLFQYCTHDGKLSTDFPVNPNGSTGNIAGLTNKAGNILALMPHPERTSAGDPIFSSLRDYLNEPAKNNVLPLFYTPRHHKLPTYRLASQKDCLHSEWIIESSLNDHEAETIAATLTAVGAPFAIRRYIHWEIEYTTEETLIALRKSEMLYNPRKEHEIPVQALRAVLQQHSNTPVHSNVYHALFLVRPHADIIGAEKKQVMNHYFEINDIKELKFGILWLISSPDKTPEEISHAIAVTNILHNPYVQECYRYLLLD